MQNSKSNGCCTVITAIFHSSIYRTWCPWTEQAQPQTNYSVTVHCT